MGRLSTTECTYLPTLQGVWSLGGERFVDCVTVCVRWVSVVFFS